MAWIAAAAATAFAVCLLTMPTAIGWLVAAGIVDRPDAQRKLHSRIVPVGGGVAVCLAMVVGASVGWPIIGVRFAVALLAAAVLLTLAGLYDDARGLRGRQKLVIQILVSCIVVYGGDIWIRGFEVFGRHFELGIFGPLFGVCWCVGTINAINLLDGADGLASIVGIALGAALVGLCLLLGKMTEAVVPAALVGALVAFLYYNKPPARVFLGDAGSQLIGLVLGATAIQASLKGPTTLALTAIVAIWSVPIFDVAIAVLRRRLTGRSLYYPDRGHLHHRLIDAGWRDKGLLFVVGALCAVTAIGAIVSVSADNEIFALFGVAAVLTVLVGGRLFGHSECKQFVKRSASLAASIVPVVRRLNRFDQPDPLGGRAIHLRGSRDAEWDRLWTDFRRFAHAQRLASARLMIHVPALDEDYSAKWAHPDQPLYERTWRVAMPINGRFGVVGSLEIAGAIAEADGSNHVSAIVADLRNFEHEILDLIEQRVEEASSVYEMAAVDLAEPGAANVAEPDAADVDAALP